MEIAANNACQAFIKTVEELVLSKKIYCLQLQFPVTEKDTSDDRALAEIFDVAFEGKSKRKGGVLLPWRQWLINSGFPNRIYLEHDKDLMKTVEDPRIIDTDFSRESTTNHNFFGRLCRPLSEHPDKTYMHYLIERWRNTKHRSFPHYYFDIEPAEWIWKELIQNPKQIKTGRSGAICATNMWFRWDVVRKRPIVGWILKHCQFTHFYQDVYAPQIIARALCKELDIAYNAVINVNFNSIFMDKVKIAKLILKGWYNRV
jgi:hypothetical protein